MATKDEIAKCFLDVNMNIEDAVLNKCLEMCLTYNIAAEDFCDQWYAFTVSNLRGAAPTVELLEKMERKEFSKIKEHGFFKTKQEEIPENFSNNNKRKNTSEFESVQLTPQRKARETPIPKTPASGRLLEETPHSLSSSEKFSQRKNSRSVQQYYGPTSAMYKREHDVHFSVSEVEEHKMPKDFRYMYEIMGKKAQSMNNIIYDMGHAIMENFGLDLSEGLVVNQMGEMITYGRILSDSDGKINAQSILLEGSDESNLNYTTRLNISQVSRYSLFPGQVVVVKGNNLKNHSFVAEQIYSKASSDLPDKLPVQNGNLQIVVAAGPFTLQENLSYEPLHELLKYVAENDPHVLILMGPFLEKTHSSISSGNINQTFDSFFQELIENIMNSVQHLDIHVVVVASQKEVHHHPVYPTPPYRIREQYNKLTFVSDPGVIDIDGLQIMMTTADVLFHMTAQELHYDREAVIKSGQMERIASHILNQKNIYPLYPSHNDVLIDHVLLEQYGMFNCKPHVLILPSTLRNFIKEIEDCLVINPQRLTSGFQAGTFARLEINPGNTKSICGRSAVQILRV